MTDHAPARRPAKNAGGRPPLDPSGRQVKCQVRLSPAERDHLERHYPTVNAALKELVRRDIAAKAGVAH